MSKMNENKYQEILDAGLRYIEEIRQLNSWDENGCLFAPFICYGCRKRRIDLELTTGDGLPLCKRYFKGNSRIDKG